MAKKKVDKWIQGTGKKKGAVHHPGALTRAAEQHGLTTKEEARREAKSPNKHIAARGRLGERFLGIAKRGNIRRKRAKKTARKRA